MGIGFTLQGSAESLLLSQAGKPSLPLLDLQWGTFSKFLTASVLTPFGLDIIWSRQIRTHTPRPRSHVMSSALLPEINWAVTSVFSDLLIPTMCLPDVRIQLIPFISNALWFILQNSCWIHLLLSCQETVKEGSVQWAMPYHRPAPLPAVAEESFPRANPGVLALMQKKFFTV